MLLKISYCVYHWILADNVFIGQGFQMIYLVAVHQFATIMNPQANLEADNVIFFS